MDRSEEELASVPTSPSIWAAVRKSDPAGVRSKLAAGAAIDEADGEGKVGRRRPGGVLFVVHIVCGGTALSKSDIHISPKLFTCIDTIPTPLVA